MDSTQKTVSRNDISRSENMFLVKKVDFLFGSAKNWILHFDVFSSIKTLPWPQCGLKPSSNARNVLYSWDDHFLRVWATSDQSLGHTSHLKLRFCLTSLSHCVWSKYGSSSKNRTLFSGRGSICFKLCAMTATIIRKRLKSNWSWYKVEYIFLGLANTGQRLKLGENTCFQRFFHENCTTTCRIWSISLIRGSNQSLRLQLQYYFWFEAKNAFCGLS